MFNAQRVNSFTVPDSDAKGKINLLTSLTFIYLASFIFEGALRYGLNYGGIGSFLYIRDLIPVLAIGWILLKWISGEQTPSALLVSLGLLLVHFVVGSFYLKSVFQQLFGLKIFLPLLFGLTLTAITTTNQKSLLKLSVVILLITVSAIVTNNFIQFPWEGAEFETAWGVLQQSRNWTADGVRRLGGFSKSSFDAASTVLCSIILIFAFEKKTVRKIIFWLVAVIGVSLTTSKGCLLALMAIFFMSLISGWGRHLAVVRLSVVTASLLVAIAPVLSLFFTIRVRDVSDSWAWYLSSYVDRMEWTWPQAFSLWFDHGNLIFGRGPGGIGVPQQFGEVLNMNPADNILVYVAISFGILGLIYGALIIAKLLNLPDSYFEKSQSGIAMMIFITAILIYGIVVNIFEQPLLAFGLGVTVGILFKDTRTNSDLVRANFEAVTVNRK